MAFSIVHTVVLMRHPQTDANVEKFFSGRDDIDINEAGRTMRDRGVKAGIAFAPDRVWTSPLRRCHAVADLVAEQLGLVAEDHDSLIEIDFGELEGTSYMAGWKSGIRFPWDIDEFGVSHPVAGGESFESMYARAEQLFDELRPLTGHTFCVTHGGMMRAIVGSLYGIPKDLFWYVRLDNVDSIIIQCDGERFYLKAFGLTPEEIVNRYSVTANPDSL